MSQRPRNPRLTAWRHAHPAAARHLAFVEVDWPGAQWCCANLADHIAVNLSDEPACAALLDACISAAIAGHRTAMREHVGDRDARLDGFLVGLLKPLAIRGVPAPSLTRILPPWLKRALAARERECRGCAGLSCHG